MSDVTKLSSDIALALAAIAEDLELEVSALPDSIAVILHSLSIAHYSAGVRDAMVRYGNHQARMRLEEIPSSTDVTPIMGVHGRRKRGE